MIGDWSSLIGNTHVPKWLGAAIANGRLGGSLLFVGPNGVGKRSVASLLARTLLCTRQPAESMSPCGTCESCVQVTAETHPDVIRVRKPDDKTLIPLELLIGRPENRMQEGFCRDIRLKSYYGKRKVAILEDADYLNEEGANCLLKTLEEPPSNALVILIGTSEQKQLPTIRSRCQVIRFAPLSPGDAARLLRQDEQIDASDEQIADAVEISAGDMHVARRLLDDQLRQFRDSFVATLDDANPDPIAIRRLFNDKVDEAGKDASAKRAVMKDVLSISIQHFRNKMRTQALAGVATGQTRSRLDRCVRAVREVDRMANASTLVDCFAADIASAATGDRGGIGS
ncbi:DNA polymerase III subunit [Stieleria varia]|uniref:DNA polymerase III subunit tau n=1 Tax=Stieleria varia TaxID=2528005 RepID=A0A5C6B7Y6_9BACT|nr:AAA family ATPase [Stieleria varia]TWU07722.1 DNA polymerase III subunit tau [Stieleria varia]